MFCQKCLSVLHNYFDGPTKLFSDLYPAKFLDTSAKPFFLYCNNVETQYTIVLKITKYILLRAAFRNFIIFIIRCKTRIEWHQAYSGKVSERSLNKHEISLEFVSPWSCEGTQVLRRSSVLHEFLHHDGNYVEQREQSCLVNEPRRAHKLYAHVRSSLQDPLRQFMPTSSEKKCVLRRCSEKKNKRPKERVTCTS